MEELKDIRPIEIITIDYTYYFITLAILLLLVVVVLYFIFRKKKILTKQQKIIQCLKELDFTIDSKKLAYDFTVYGKECIDERYADEFYKIVDKLEQFKYKKTIDKTIDEDIIDDMKEYIRVRL